MLTGINLINSRKPNQFPLDDALMFAPYQQDPSDNCCVSILKEVMFDDNLLSYLLLAIFFIIFCIPSHLPLGRGAYTIVMN